MDKDGARSENAKADGCPRYLLNERPLYYTLDAERIALRIEEAVEELESARTEAEKARAKLMEEEASLEEAEKQSEAAEAAVKESEIVSFWVLNLLASRGQDLDSDFCTISSKEAWNKLEAAQYAADAASARVKSAKASSKLAEEKAKAAQDAVKKCEEVASGEIKSMIDTLSSQMDKFVRDWDLDQYKWENFNNLIAKYEQNL